MFKNEHLVQERSMNRRANEICQSQRRQTISSADIFAALKQIEMDEKVPELEIFLAGKIHIKRVESIHMDESNSLV